MRHSCNFLPFGVWWFTSLSFYWICCWFQFESICGYLSFYFHTHNFEVLKLGLIYLFLRKIANWNILFKKSAKGCVKSHAIDNFNSACEISHCVWIFDRIFGPHLYVGRWQVQEEILGQVVRWVRVRCCWWVEWSGGVGGWLASCQPTISSPASQQQRDLTLPLSSLHTCSPNYLWGMSIEKQSFEMDFWGERVTEFMKMWEDIWEVSKVHLHFLVYLQSCQTLQDQWSILNIQRRKEAADIVCGLFSPSLYARHYSQPSVMPFHRCAASPKVLSWFFPKARAIRAKAGCSPFGKWQDATRLNLVKDWLQLGLTLASNISFNIPQLCQDLPA